MPEEIPHRMENEGLQKQAVVSTLQSGFLLDALQQRGILRRNIPNDLQEQSHWKQEDGLIVVTFIRMGSWKICGSCGATQ
jgi:hypothetical protein